MSTATGEAATNYRAALGDRVGSLPGVRALERAKLALILFQLGLLAIVIRQFQIESDAFLRISLLAFAGFFVHYFLPAAYRLPFFALLSLSGIALVMGAGNAAALISMGMLLIALCHLPVSFGAHFGLLAVGVILAVFRLELMAGPWSSAVWPILGSMFMFRLIVTSTTAGTTRRRSRSGERSATSSLLPNVCFPLFSRLSCGRNKKGVSAAW